MDTKTEIKRELYITICEQISPLWKQDEMFSEQDPVTWQLVRSIDDWLYQYRDNDRVKEDQYGRICRRLMELYPQRNKG